jgi:hypothetical protein
MCFVVVKAERMQEADHDYGKYKGIALIESRELPLLLFLGDKMKECKILPI